MSQVTHFLTGWVFANCARLDRRDRALVTLACVAPDVDGLGIVPELLTRNSLHLLPWFSVYHHSLHSLAPALVISGVSVTLAQQRWKTGLLAFVSFHLHLVENLAGSRGSDGYEWPIPYLKPFSSAWSLSWQGQWTLNSWLNIAITAAPLLATFYLSGLVARILAA
jgi:inner membrane protein